jgi:hypothetical protein
MACQVVVLLQPVSAGYAALAGVCSIGYWKSLNFFGKAAVVQYIATAVFQFLFKVGLRGWGGHLLNCKGQARFTGIQQALS